MLLSKHWMLNLGLAALTLGATVSGASAREVYKGTFSLESEAYWGDTLLEPGQYTILIDTDLTKTPLVQLRGNGVNIAIMALPVRNDPQTNHSLLKLGEYSQGYAVQELQAGPLGQTFHFAVAKRVRQGTESAAAGRTTVPVSTGNAAALKSGPKSAAIR